MPPVLDERQRQGEPLQNIQENSPEGIISELLRIQEEYPLNDAKSWKWASELECLAGRKKPPKRSWNWDESPGNYRPVEFSNVVERERRRNEKYVAVSYTWAESPDDDPTAGGWQIKTSARGKKPRPAKVRDSVIRRALQYAAYRKARWIWIDRECIPQHDCPEREMALQSMDLVYRASQYPVALLSTRITSTDDLELLMELLQGEIVSPGERIGTDRDAPFEPPAFQEDISAKTLAQILSLLDHIVSDIWFERAWTFQEDYCASIRMALLIPVTAPRSPSMEHIFGTLPNDIIVSSADFKEYATLFALAYLRTGTSSSSSPSPSRAKAENLLRRAGKYRTLHKHGQAGASGGDSRNSLLCRSISTSVFRDLWYRGIAVRSDMLAIAANCCGYEQRFNSKALAEEDSSCTVDLCLLAMWFLNGEIFDNDTRAAETSGDRRKKLRELNVVEYMAEITLRNFVSPVDEKPLSFLKKCRFVDARLTPEGVSTKGWLWKLDSEMKLFEDGHWDGQDDSHWAEEAEDIDVMYRLVDELRRHGLYRLAGMLKKAIPWLLPYEPDSNSSSNNRFMYNSNDSNNTPNTSNPLNFTDGDDIEQDEGNEEGVEQDGKEEEKEDEDTEEKPRPSRPYMRLMSRLLIAAIRARKRLLLAHHPSSKDPDAYVGIFVAPDTAQTASDSPPTASGALDDDVGAVVAEADTGADVVVSDSGGEESDAGPGAAALDGASVFTAWQWEGPDEGKVVESGRQDKYVSLLVREDGAVSTGRGKETPLLRTVGWVNGLVFCGRRDEGKVVFGWPGELVG